MLRGMTPRRALLGGSFGHLGSLLVRFPRPPHRTEVITYESRRPEGCIGSFLALLLWPAEPAEEARLIDMVINTVGVRRMS